MNDDHLYGLYLQYFALVRSGYVLDPKMFVERREIGGSSSIPGYTLHETVAITMGAADAKSERISADLWDKPSLSRLIKKKLGEG
ncbi:MULTISPECIES: hypothetical protein [unclassified Corallococcus]|uniref:hypothetical protein n=1 Tax=unclassified Corallococcus TaxID=2685029 RepID=UPI001A8C3D26|nr:MULTISPECIES: hypothetical protein [unclassified Corallococcus]MBN9687110.1 hypothetical protein [Corallococcus sp. NCSPR001]WAS89062.1 hypothetical protein O0N60_19270 [Corallococcus sp. NCRR]